MNGRQRVLVADDDAEMREIVAEYLAGQGFDVLEAANGLEALLCVKREQPQAVVLDINMPRLGGLEALKHIHAFSPATRVVVYSGAVEPEVERLARAGGAVAVFSKPGVLEDLRLAVTGEASIHTPPEVAQTVSNGRSRPAAEIPAELRILLIDDEPTMLDLLGDFLKLQGARTFSVTSAVEALRLLAQGAPDVIFLDIEMAGLSGLEALPAIKALAPQARVVMISGINDEAIAKQALARGAFDYVVKPIDFDYLRQTLDTIATMRVQGL